MTIFETIFVSLRSDQKQQRDKDQKQQRDKDEERGLSKIAI